MPLFTILCPAHLECRCIEHTIQSVLDQSIADFEFFIVGDGCDQQAKDRINGLCAQDSRLTFFDNPKGERHGEANRHKALKQANGEYIVYISDDDLFLPNHLELLKVGFETGANFVHTLPLEVLVDGQIGVLPGHINNPKSTASMLDGRNFLPLTGTAHTRELYFSLTVGWSPAPVGVYTDLFMWQKFLQAPNFKPLALFEPTYLHFTAKLRKDWPAEKITAEIREWSKRIKEPGAAKAISTQALHSLVNLVVDRNQQVLALKRKAEELDSLLIVSRKRLQ
jgi:glycosyltransferase involved in cell wall biosynthesis